jgi:hypothetical protein
MTYRDEFDEPPRGSGFLGRIGPKAAFFAVLIALSFMIGVVWKLYVGANSPDNKGVPIVRADADPFKVTPEEPGGMEIPHKDSTIFSSLDGEKEGRVENLLAENDDEEPMPRSQLFAGLNTERNPDLETDNQPTPLDQPASSEAQKVAKESEETEEVVNELLAERNESVMPPPPEEIRAGEITDPETKAIMEDPQDVEPAATTETRTAPVQAPEQEEEKVASVSKNEAAKPVMTSGNYYVQLASITDKSRAESEWNKLTKKYSSQLSGYSYRIETADLGAKGIYHRIQAGPVSKEQAVATCEAIKKVSPGGCLVKKQ